MERRAVSSRSDRLVQAVARRLASVPEGPIAVGSGSGSGSTGWARTRAIAIDLARQGPQ
ncbi:Uncharacterised protein [Bordetella ansorpii]|uniref:Uncharacterized protein n=1 Tax=Bordetella ansorpii TaxID=288768 RepID=A0A157SV72_9BORD|nr:hypothetical protein [Bordetella ansorpii]SAI74350.1 Uncharacterised protein [Bordetella ansorpii]